MIDHRRALDLAAIGIDFDLDPVERRTLDEHLAACGSCRSDALGLRADASALAGLPSIEPPAWVRRAIGRRHGPHRAVLLVAAALLLVATVGVALAVGAAIRERTIQVLVPDRTPSTSPAAPGPSDSPRTSASASASTSASPNPSASLSPLPIPAPVSFPSNAGTAWIGAGPAGSTWVLTVHEGGTASDPSSVSAIALLDPAGRPRPGWPIALTGWRCGEDGPPAPLPVATDGSIRLACAEDSVTDGPLRHAGFAFDTAGRSLPGWPMELPETGLTTSATVVGDELILVSSDIASTEGSGSADQAATWRLVAVSATGSVRVGRPYDVGNAAGNFDVRVAPNGIAYRLAFSGTTEAIRTELTAFDLDGVRPGWPVTIDGITSMPALRPDGSVAVVRLTKPGLTSQVVTIGSSGGDSVTRSDDLRLDPIDDRTGAGSVLLSPLVGSDGTIWVAGTSESTKPAIVRIAPNGDVTGPFATEMPLQPRGVCDGQDTGCGVWRTRPDVGPDGTLYVPLSAVGDGGGLASSSGGSMAAIGPNGRSRAGWPVSLPDTMAGYWAVIARDDGTLGALAVVPTDGGNDWAFVILGHDGAAVATTPVIAP